MPTVDFTAPYWSEIKELLGVPVGVNPVALIPLGYPDRARYGPTTRRPWREVTHWDAWGNVGE